MCFSATASFTASTFLLLCSFATLTKATKKQRMLAAIPLLFAIQQFIEGMIWHRLEHNQDLVLYDYGFIFFVFMVWPLWVPLSLRAMCTTKADRAAFRFPVLAGALVAFFAVAHLGMTPLRTTISCSHISYGADLNPSLITIMTILYLFATIAPFFITKISHARLMGAALAVSYLITYIFYSYYIISVWCFFVALLSLITYFIIG